MHRREISTVPCDNSLFVYIIPLTKYHTGTRSTRLLYGGENFVPVRIMYSEERPRLMKSSSQWCGTDSACVVFVKVTMDSGLEETCTCAVYVQTRYEIKKAQHGMRPAPVKVYSCNHHLTSPIHTMPSRFSGASPSPLKGNRNHCYAG